MKKTKYDRIEVAQYKPDSVKCLVCEVLFNVKDKSQWSGLIHRPCGQRLLVLGLEHDLSFIWCLKANVGDDETSRFRPGASVFLYPPLWVTDIARLK